MLLSVIQINFALRLPALLPQATSLPTLPAHRVCLAASSMSHQCPVCLEPSPPCSPHAFNPHTSLAPARLTPSAALVSPKPLSSPDSRKCPHCLVVPYLTMHPCACRKPSRSLTSSTLPSISSWRRYMSVSALTCHASRQHRDCRWYCDNDTC